NKKQIFKIKKNTDYLKRFQVRYDFSTKNNIDLFGVQKQYELLKDFSDQDALFEYLAENQRIALFNLKGEDFLEAGKIVAYDPKKKLLKTEAITDWYYGATPKKIKLKNIYALEIYSAEIYFLEI
ncbi:MAG: hypothetical protein LBC17_02580, partial [Lactobacillaceae bacterium]|nr:hypothetical protein [Lactobacillaceae bacterium]